SRLTRCPSTPPADFAGSAGGGGTGRPRGAGGASVLSWFGSGRFWNARSDSARCRILKNSLMATARVGALSRASRSRWRGPERPVPGDGLHPANAWTPWAAPIPGTRWSPRSEPVLGRSTGPARALEQGFATARRSWPAALAAWGRGLLG